ncbi:hypothetical protein EVAR_69610_1 [Eumeta japonica]|uniref:Uncharacterized protein n=1 Tax=Eumeta variegata TaxID=151549 RepID=A0A4C2A802_EUMVA|nr:hypothetical protein EVAR_69610_1 [Eumeta japonica]
MPLYYETGQLLAKADESSGACWFYRNGNIALIYYNDKVIAQWLKSITYGPEETRFVADELTDNVFAYHEGKNNVIERHEVFKTGKDERGRDRPVAVLAVVIDRTYILMSREKVRNVLTPYDGVPPAPKTPTTAGLAQFDSQLHSP